MHAHFRQDFCARVWQNERKKEGGVACEGGTGGGVAAGVFAGRVFTVMEIPFAPFAEDCATANANIWIATWTEPRRRTGNILFGGGALFYEKNKSGFCLI